MASRQQIRVLVATQQEEVYEILEARDDVVYDIALYTGSIRDLVPQVQLAIIDYEDIVEYPLSEADVREQLFASGVYECRSQDFVTNPERFLEGLTLSQPGHMVTLPSRYCIAFLSYSGGTGRTTLAVDTAMYYATLLKKRSPKGRGKAVVPFKGDQPCMLVEMAYGVSSLTAITGLDMNAVMKLATDPDAEMSAYHGIDLVPMDYENVRMLDTDLLQRFYSRQITRHGLTLVDCIWPHGMASALAAQVDLWIVVGSERPDTVVNAVKLFEELRAEYPDRVWLLQNQVSDESLNHDDPDTPWNVRLPRIARPDEYRGELGRAVLSKVFSPLWSDYDNQRKPGLFGS